MLVIFQFPMADLRSLSADGLPVSLPPLSPLSFKNVKVADNFHYFGIGAERTKGADHAFKDESRFYSARNALYLEKLGDNIFARGGLKSNEESRQSAASLSPQNVMGIPSFSINGFRRFVWSSRSA